MNVGLTDELKKIPVSSCVGPLVCTPTAEPFGVKNDHYQSEKFVCVSVIMGLMQILSWMWLLMISIVRH